MIFMCVGVCVTEALSICPSLPRKFSSYAQLCGNRAPQTAACTDVTYTMCYVGGVLLTVCICGYCCSVLVHTLMYKDFLPTPTH